MLIVFLDSCETVSRAFFVVYCTQRDIITTTPYTYIIVSGGGVFFFFFISYVRNNKLHTRLMESCAAAVI